MKSLSAALALLILCLSGFSQLSIFYENFGNTGFFRAPANTYNGYSSDKNLFSSDSIGIHNWAPVSSYAGASGQSFALCGKNGNNLMNIIQIGPISTSDYSSIGLSFGAATWYGFASDYMSIYYSINGKDWSQLDDASLSHGQYNSASWGYVTLSQQLPSSSSLYLRFLSTSMEQAVKLDDITLTGYTVDVNPPSKPSSLVLLEKDSQSISIRWDPSSDESGVDHYLVYANGEFIMASPTASASLQYLNAGQNYLITVKAADPGGNMSAESDALAVSLDELPPGHRYSWQKPHALVHSNGDLEWDPEAFSYEAGNSQRYIDYVSGNDANDGQSPSSAWKHHPWDPQATGNAKNETGIHTYLFKRGVVYRGTLSAKQSGEPGNPIRLTSDPSWGTGEAAFFGSVQFTDGWTRSSVGLSPKIPEADKVWYRNISLPVTSMIAEVTGNETKRIRIARTPNFRHTPDDPLKTWPVMTSKTFSEAANQLVLGDRVNFTQPNEDYYKGGTIWSQEDVIVMCTVWGQEILSYNPAQQIITVSNGNFGGIGSHYFIENTPYLLDTTSEYYHDRASGRLYIRLDGDKDPNTALIEVATKSELITINNKQYIEISGLSFGFTTNSSIRFGYADVKSTIRMTGFCSNITIKNNNFRYVNGGISLESPGSPEQRSRNITVSDNDFHVVDDLAMVFAANSDVYVENINILRNRIYDNGGRQRGRWYSSIPAIWGQLISGEIAGNIIDFSWGNGINMFWGKGGSSGRTVPFIRGLYHHNKASNTLLGTNDYGGIESWQGGPVYIFNNISHNASGYKHYNNTSIGEAFYVDGSFKHILFNNIASGVSIQRNNTAFMQVLGYYNMYVHNTGYNIKNLFSSGANDLRSNGHNAYLSNIGDKVNTFFNHSVYSQYVPFEAYGNNISSTNPFKGSILEKSNQFSLENFLANLESFHPRLSQTGWNANAPVLENPAVFDFRPRIDGEAIDRGVKFFTAFPLSSVVGEWNFYKQNGDSSIIMAENFYMTAELSNRTSYHSVPKNHLSLKNMNDSTFRYGQLEDWMKGAVYFDGQSTYASLSHSLSSSKVCNNVDMTGNNFIIEAYFKTEPAHTNGILVSKTDGANGYELGIDALGNAEIRLLAGSIVCSLSSTMPVNDGNWYHVLAEVDRNGQLRIFINGSASAGLISGTVPGPETSLSNPSDLLVGKNADEHYFHGIIDFLRISRGTLRESRTTIHELYTWMTDGPFHYDFAGKQAIGKRDAGAIEGGVKTCYLTIDKELLEFDADSSSRELQVIAPEGYSLYSSQGDFFTTILEETRLNVEVASNPDYASREGEIVLYGCNESKRIKITQLGSPCRLEVDFDTLWFDYSSSILKIKVDANDAFTAKRNASFFLVNINPSGDSITVTSKENSLGPERSGAITLSACDKTIVLQVIQRGDPNSVWNKLPAGVKIYPNPLNDRLITISLPAEMDHSELIITDLGGKLVFNRNSLSTHNNFDLPLEKGIYLLNIKGKIEDIRTKLVVH